MTVFAARLKFFLKHLTDNLQLERVHNGRLSNLESSMEILKSTGSFGEADFLILETKPPVPSFFMLCHWR